jgi:hypothetical protein
MHQLCGVATSLRSRFKVCISWPKHGRKVRTLDTNREATSIRACISHHAGMF